MEHIKTTLGTTPVKLLDTNPARQVFGIQHQGATGTAYYTFKEADAIAGTGWGIAAGNSKEIGGVNVSTCEVWGYASEAGVPIVLEHG